MNSSPRRGVLGAAEYLANKGRKGDDVIVHATTGEAVVPQEILEKNPELKEDLFSAFTKEAVDPNQYVIGSGVMSINPDTNLPEFGWLSKTWKSVRKLVKKAGPAIGTVIGYMVGGPIGASIGAGIGTKTSAQEGIGRNMALAYIGGNMAKGAGVGGGGGGGIKSLFQGSTWGNTFKPSTWTPMGTGQAGIGGMFQDVGSGLARNMGIGGTQSLNKLVSSGDITAAQAKSIATEMAAKGVGADVAATNLGLNLSSTAMAELATAGPGAMSSFTGAYGSLNPLEKWAVQEVGKIGTGFYDQQREGRMGQPPSYLTSNLRSGPAIPNAPIAGSAATPTSSAGNPFAAQQGQYRSASQSTGGISTMPVGNSRASMDLAKGNRLLDGVAQGTVAPLNPRLGSLLTPYPDFPIPGPSRRLERQVAAKDGGFIGASRPLFNMGGFAGHARGPGGPKDDLIDAKLSNNEFVMTAKAVEGAGNGNIEQGAKRMYQLMDRLEEVV